ncbi:choice-of-anchor A family protein [Streptomyces sp. NPDC020817]|uniref:choice-of-anchor A family protein n=1 Tax=Streptomyces sp. NPDC020817 TaxID=3365095 RepID=UPI0037AB71C8
MSARNWTLGLAVGAVLAAGSSTALAAAPGADRPVREHAAPVRAALRAPLPDGLGPCVPGRCPDPFPPVAVGTAAKGYDDAVNVFVGGDFRVRARAAEAEGKVVVLGSFDQDKDPQAGQAYNIGIVGAGSLVQPPPGSDFLATGQDVRIAAGERLISDGGVVRYAGTAPGPGRVTGPLVQDAAAVAKYAGLRDRLTAASKCYARVDGQLRTATGTAVNASGTTVFTGDNASRLQIFNVDFNMVSGGGGGAGGAVGIRFDRIPADATVLVNVLGAARTISTYSGAIDDAHSPWNALRTRLLWNFPDATTVHLQGSGQFQGAVLIGEQASQTTVTLPGMNGRFFTTGTLTHTSVDGLGGGQEFHAYPFDGDLPDCTVTPPVPVTGSVSVLKRDETGEPLAGAHFELWRETNGVSGAQFTGDADTKVADCVTPADGICARESELGTYYWRETAAPDGYVLPERRVFPLTLTAENATVGARYVVDNVKAVPPAPTGRVAVHKVDADGTTPLARATFQLWRETNGRAGLQTDGAGGSPDTLVENACLTGADGRCERVVEPGTYHWRETVAPAGYELPAQPVTTVVLTEADVTAGITATVVNVKEYRGVLEVLKKDAKTKRPLRGAVFEVWKETNGTAGLQTAGINADVLVKAGCATDGAGVCTFEYLEAGAYYLRETDVPEGYVLPEDRVTGPLRLDERTPGQKLVVTVDNRRDDHGKGKGKGKDGDEHKGGGKGGKGGGRG